MTSSAVTPYDDKTARTARRRFWLTTAALGRPANKQVMEEQIRASQQPSVQLLLYLWCQRCKCKRRGSLAWRGIWGTEVQDSLLPLPLYRRSFQFQECDSARSSGGRWRLAPPERATHLPQLPSALRCQNTIYNSEYMQISTVIRDKYDGSRF